MTYLYGRQEAVSKRIQILLNTKFSWSKKEYQIESHEWLRLITLYAKILVIDFIIVDCSISRKMLNPNQI